MKPYLLTMSSETPGMNRFRKSLEKLEGNYEHIAVQFTPFSDMATTAKHDFPYPGHLKRHQYIPDNLDPERHVIFCDTDDVIFQKPLPELEYDMYLAAENVVHKNTIWHKVMEETVFDTPLQEREVFNCGMYILKVKILYEYRQFVQELWTGEFNKYNWEQPHFNYFVSLHPEYSRVIDLSILCPLYDNIGQGLVMKGEDGIWRTKTGKVVSIIHSNGNKGLL